MATQTIAAPSVPLQFPQHIGAAKEPITQLELELLLSLRNRLAQLEAQIAAEEATFQARLEAGAPVEPGTHHVELKENWRRNVSWKSVAIRLAKRLKLNGAAYCARVLASTKPTRSISVEIS
jgi:hypothetical protein